MGGGGQRDLRTGPRFESSILWTADWRGYVKAMGKSAKIPLKKSASFSVAFLAS
jgi:hypothetical protein